MRRSSDLAIDLSEALLFEPDRLHPHSHLRFCLYALRLFVCDEQYARHCLPD
jgi:hypothetical protein